LSKFRWSDFIKKEMISKWFFPSDVGGDPVEVIDM
jgi:hypothetical protein